MPRIVVITDHRDVHVPAVSAHLGEGFAMTTIDTSRVIEGEDLSYEQSRTGGRVIYRDEPLTDVAGVWYRKPTPRPAGSLPVAPEYQRYGGSAVDQLGQCLNVQFADAVWVSDFYAISRARPKAGQLATAARLGFGVPETLMTSSPERAREFVRQHDTCIAKPLAVRFPPGKAFYATLVRDADELNYPGLAVDPLILQVAIAPAAELRVTVVGDEVFAAEVGSSAPASEQSRVRDWRACVESDRFWAKEVVPPAGLADRCRSYLAAYGLRFGAFDFVIDERGECWFLECNANGQWLFVEDETGMPIGAAMARLLTGGAGRP